MSRGLQPARSPAPARTHSETSTTEVTPPSGLLSPQNATGIAGLPLTTKAAIGETKDKKAASRAGGDDFDY